MGPPLTHRKLTQMWRAGYCRETVEFARTTRDSATGARARVDYLRDHVKTCHDCRLANILKGIERDIAKQLGPAALALFTMGGDITELPGFRKCFMSYFPKMKEIIPELNTAYAQEWLTRSAQRDLYNEEDGENEPNKAPATDA